MAWRDKLYDAVYTSASGVESTFDCTVVNENVTSRGTAFQFIDYDGTYVQRTGMSGRQFPVKCIFSGATYDEDAAAFIDALSESGTGQLTLPILGTKTVVPLGEIKRVDQLVQGANQSIISLTFLQTDGLVYPSTDGDAAASATAAISDASETVAEQAVTDLAFDTTLDEAQFSTRYTGALGTVKSSLSQVASTESSIQRKFNRVYSSITDSIQTLVGDPLTLVQNTINLVNYPAQASSNISARLSAYSNLLDDLIGSSAESVTEYQAVGAVAQATILAQATAGTTAAAADATSEQGFQTRDRAVTAAADLIDAFETYSEWRDTAQQDFDDIPTDSGAGIQALTNVVAAAAGAMLQSSFGLATRRTYRVREYMTIVNLCARLYGEITDDRLNQMIAANAMPGDKILELQPGDQVIYYA